jgi:hypothetical protein
MNNIEVLEKNKKFFKEYKSKFIELFLKIVKENILSQKEIELIYNILFIKPFLFRIF